MEILDVRVWELKPCEGIRSLRYSLGGERGQETEDTNEETLDLPSPLSWTKCVSLSTEPATEPCPAQGWPQSASECGPLAEVLQVGP